jgi:hypothetical protein
VKKVANTNGRTVVWGGSRVIDRKLLCVSMNHLKILVLVVVGFPSLTAMFPLTLNGKTEWQSEE